MNKLRYILLFVLFPLSLQAEEFVVHQIYSNNFILKAIAAKIIKKETDNKITISFKDNIAYISYNSAKKTVEFYKSDNNGRFYFKRKKSHVAKLFIKDAMSGKEAYFILEKNGKRKIQVSLKQA